MWKNADMASSIIRSRYGLKVSDQLHNSVTLTSGSVPIIRYKDGWVDLRAAQDKVAERSLPLPGIEPEYPNP